MTKDKFMECINEAEQILLNTDKDDMEGVCSALDDVFWGSELSQDFGDLFEPDEDDKAHELVFQCGYWLGARCRRNLNKRLMYLRMFEQATLVSGKYKKYKIMKRGTRSNYLLNDDMVTWL